MSVDHTLESLAAVANHEHVCGEEATRKGLSHYRTAGDALIEAKRQLEHGAWLKWLKANVVFDRRTATRYMRVASKWDTVSHLEGLRDALDVLANGDRSRLARAERKERKEEAQLAAEIEAAEMEAARKEAAEMEEELLEEEMEAAGMDAAEKEAVRLEAKMEAARLQAEMEAARKEAAGIRCSLRATVIVAPGTDPKELEQFLRAGQARWVLKNGRNETLDFIRVETVESLERLPEMPRAATYESEREDLPLHWMEEIDHEALCSR